MSVGGACPHLPPLPLTNHAVFLWAVACGVTSPTHFTAAVIRRYLRLHWLLFCTPKRRGLWVRGVAADSGVCRHRLRWGLAHLLRVIAAQGRPPRYGETVHSPRPLPNSFCYAGVLLRPLDKLRVLSDSFGRLFFLHWRTAVSSSSLWTRDSLHRLKSWDSAFDRSRLHPPGTSGRGPSSQNTTLLITTSSTSSLCLVRS